MLLRIWSVKSCIARGTGSGARSGVKLTKDEKRVIGRPSSPGWELDIVGYSAARNELLVVECKSYLDSGGVAFSAFDGSNPRFANRFKLFNEETVRRIVLNRLRLQLAESGHIGKVKDTTLALACGKIASDEHRRNLCEHFKRNRWFLWDDHWLKDRLEEISQGGYENSEIAVVSKLLLR